MKPPPFAGPLRCSGAGQEYAAYGEPAPARIGKKKIQGAGCVVLQAMKPMQSRANITDT
jgi:hypothetical protein